MQRFLSYAERKHRELLLLNRCLGAPLDALALRSNGTPIAQKFHLAALLKAEHSLRRWSVTETARPPSSWQKVGAFAFSFGYQRADLEVRGPPLYRSLATPPFEWDVSTIYAGSGMGAIAALLSASLQLRDTLCVVAPRDCYAETRELIASLGARVRTVPLEWRSSTALEEAAGRILWLDSSVRSSASCSPDRIAEDVDLVVFDTTCFWRHSHKIGSVVARALQLGIPIVLVRSHAKLDSLGIEYGRLGSLVVAMPRGVRGGKRSSWTAALVPRLRDAVRLLGAAPTLAHFPPFESASDYVECSAARTASIIRNTRRLGRGLRLELPQLVTFQHGLYVTVPTHAGASVEDARRTAGAMADELAAQGFPVKHAGSFGFDFVAVEWCLDPLTRANLVRISGGDLPLELSDEIGAYMAQRLFHHVSASRSRYGARSDKATA